MEEASTLGIKCTWCQSRLHSAFVTMPSFTKYSCLWCLRYILSQFFSYLVVSLARFSSPHSLKQHISQGSVPSVHLFTCKFLWATSLCSNGFNYRLHADNSQIYSFGLNLNPERDSDKITCLSSSLLNTFSSNNLGISNSVIWNWAHWLQLLLSKVWETRSHPWLILLLFCPMHTQSPRVTTVFPKYFLCHSFICFLTITTIT